jgi:hypothetical protein
MLSSARGVLMLHCGRAVVGTLLSLSQGDSNLRHSQGKMGVDAAGFPQVHGQF